MKQSTKRVIFIILLSLAFVFTSGFFIYVQWKINDTDHKLVKLVDDNHQKYENLRELGKLSSFQGYEYGKKYLNDRNLLSQGIVLPMLNGIVYPLDKPMDSCKFEDYFFAAFKLCLVEAYTKNYLKTKNDEIALKLILDDFNSIKTDYYKMRKI